jgi:putative membrane protein
MLPIYAYAEHLLASLVLLVVFVGVYTRITPFNEFALIRQGNVAAALAGWQHARFLLHAVVESPAQRHLSDVPGVVGGDGGAGSGLRALARALPDMDAAIESNNMAMGGLMGTMSVSVGVLNAACLS